MVTALYASNEISFNLKTKSNQKDLHDWIILSEKIVLFNMGELIF